VVVAGVSLAALVVLLVLVTECAQVGLEPVHAAPWVAYADATMTTTLWCIFMPVM
jgi:hypothetical protein